MMEIPLLNSRQSEPLDPPRPVDAFLERPSRLCGFYTLAAYGFGGLLIGLTLHSFPSFRPVALAVALVIVMLLIGIVGYPVVQQRIMTTRRYGVGPIYPGSKGKPKLIDGSVLLAAFTPVAALFLLICIGVIIGML